MVAIRTTFCQEYLENNLQVAEQLIKVMWMIRTKFNLAGAEYQFDSVDYLGNPKGIHWHLKVANTDKQVGELVHPIHDSLCQFYFKPWLDDDGEELEPIKNKIHTRLALMSEVWKTKEDIMNLLRNS